MKKKKRRKSQNTQTVCKRFHKKLHFSMLNYKTNDSAEQCLVIEIITRDGRVHGRVA